MSFVIEGAHGLWLHPDNSLKYADVIEPSGVIWTTDGDNSHWWWRTKTVVYKDWYTEERVTTKGPISARRAAQKYAEQAAPTGTIIGEISQNGEATVFKRVDTGEKVRVASRWLPGSRRADLFTPDQDWLGVPKLRRRDSYRVSTVLIDKWRDKNLATLQDAASRLTRVEGSVIFARQQHLPQIAS